MRLIRCSRLTASLLADYAIDDYVFDFDSGVEMRRCIASCDRQGVRILRMCVPFEWDEPLLHESTGAPVLPASLIALVFGSYRRMTERIPSLTNTALHDALHINESTDGVVSADDAAYLEEISARCVRMRDNDDSSILTTWQANGVTFGEFDQHIPRGALPTGLRVLQFGPYFDQPLQAGSIPDTVEWLQFGDEFDQPLAVGHLPASLTHLAFGNRYNQQLLPNVLPHTLR